MSTVNITGNATRAPELRYSAGGAAVAKFGIAENRRWQSGGEAKEATGFYDVSCFGTLAENVASSIDKGDRVVVVGRLEHRTWETPDGTKRSAVEIVADSIGVELRFATATVQRNERTTAIHAAPGAVESDVF